MSEGAPTQRAASPLTIAWCVVAGILLLLVPADPALWGRVVGGHDVLESVAGTNVVRLAISAFGLLLLLVATADLATLFGMHRQR